MPLKTALLAPIILLQAGVLLVSLVSAASPGGPAPDSLQKKERFALPIEMDFDSGADNGNAIITRLLPVNVIPLKNDWQLVNIATLVFADAPGGITGIAGNPEPISGPHVFGLGDFSDALIFSRKKKNGFAWGVGAIMSFPIATDERLGSGKWSAGPAIRLAYDKGPWRFGMVAGNFSSFAGDDDRSDIDQLLIRGLIKRELNDGWFLKYSPIITANWEAESSQR